MATGDGEGFRRDSHLSFLPCNFIPSDESQIKKSPLLLVDDEEEEAEKGTQEVLELNEEHKVSTFPSINSSSCRRKIK